MKRVAFILVIVLACNAARFVSAAPEAVPAADAPPESLFVAGNASYEAGAYALAADYYAEVVKAGVVNADLYYNLGNTLFKCGDLGWAILWYERALRLEPRNEDVRANLAVVRSLLRDQQLVPAQGGVRGALLAWHRHSSAGESAAVAAGFYALFTLAGLCVIFRRTDFMSALYRKLSWLSPGRLFGLSRTQDLLLALGTSAALALVFAGSAYTKARDASENPRSVVVREEVNVFSGPSRDATVQFKVHAGTIVSVRDGRPGWVRVDLPGDLSGWVDAETVEKI